MSEQTILVALKTILPANTTVAPDSVFIRQGISPEMATWPVVTLNVPLSDDDQVTLGGPGSGAFQTVHVVHCLYLDRWESSQRTYEQIMQDASDQLEQMKVNVRSNPSLRVNGVDACLEVRHIQKRMLEPLDKAQLGFPAIQAQLVIWIADFMQVYSP